MSTRYIPYAKVEFKTQDVVVKEGGNEICYDRGGNSSNVLVQFQFALEVYSKVKCDEDQGNFWGTENKSEFEFDEIFPFES